MQEVQIGLVLPMWSASSVVGGFTVGPGIDRYGLLFGLVFGACCAVIAFVCTWYGNEKLVSCDSFVARAHTRALIRVHWSIQSKGLVRRRHLCNSLYLCLT